MLEQQKLHGLLQLPRKSAQHIREILKVIKDGSLGMVDAVLEYSQLLLTKYPKEAKSQQPVYLDMYALAALEMEVEPKDTVDRAVHRLRNYFKDNRYMHRLQITKNHLNRKEKEENFVTGKTLIVKMINEDLTDFESRKKDLSIIKVIVQFIQLTSSLEEYITRLNNHLEVRPNDVEAWQELGLIYQQYSCYHRALFCYQQLILVCPQNDHYYVRIGELFMTQGGTQNIKYAKDYFCYVVTRNDRNYRALWCLYKACARLIEDDNESQTIAQLLTVNHWLIQATKDKLQQFYNTTKNSKVTLSRFKF